MSEILKKKSFSLSILVNIPIGKVEDIQVRNVLNYRYIQTLNFNKKKRILCNLDLA